MKNGGADVHVVRSKDANEVLNQIRQWHADVNKYEPPSAFVAVAFWPGDAGHEGQRHYLVGWHTKDAALPLPALMQLAAAQVVQEGHTIAARERIMRELGYVPDESA